MRGYRNYLIAISLLLYIITCFLFGIDIIVVSLKWILIIAQVLTLLFVGHNLIIGYFGVTRSLISGKSRTLPPHKRFAVLVAAHNEEAVIGDIVDNLNQLDYPKNLYDVYVICDNCTDRTAEIVKSKNGNAMERHDTSKKGKGYGLEWMFQRLWEMEDKGKVYDAIVMFDADNLVNRSFLSAVNSDLTKGYEVIQGYLDSKNPKDTWITKSYAYSYWATNRLFQLARQSIGLSAQLGGTGVVVSTRVLKEFGWGATSLTEDLEFTQRYIMGKGRKAKWCHKAIVYDEKPLHMKFSWKQRIRWMQGHADCMTRYALPMLKTFLKKRKFFYFDAFMYLVTPIYIMMVSVYLVFLGLYYANEFLIDNNAIRTFAHDTFLFGDISNWVTISLILFYFLPIWSLIIEKKYKELFWLPYVYIFSLTWFPITIIGYLKRKQKVWSHTQHTRRISIDELAKSKTIQL